MINRVDYVCLCLHCCDGVGWATGVASSLLNNKRLSFLTIASRFKRLSANLCQLQSSSRLVVSDSFGMNMKHSSTEIHSDFCITACMC